MKFKITFLVILGFLCLGPGYLFAQCDVQRQSIEDLDGDEQCELRNLMLEYLSQGFDDTQGPNDWNKYPIVNMHIDPPFGSFGSVSWCQVLLEDKIVIFKQLFSGRERPARRSAKCL